MTSTVRRLAAVLLGLALVIGACSSDDDGGDGAASDTTAAGQETTTTAPGGETLQILLTNDDGVGAEGIDAVATALRELPDTEVTIVAPAENQSGTGDRTTDGPLTAEPATTASGLEATAVQGFPADTVVWALDEGDLPETPDLVVSGINEGQNIGPIAALSGTVGAAREAARRGIPALGVSAGLVNPNSDNEIVEYEDAVDLVVEWVAAQRDELLARGETSEPADVANLNVPTCVTGELRGQLEVPLASDTGGANVFVADCTSTLEDPPDDVQAFVNGFAALSEMNVTAMDTQLESVSVND